MRAWVDGLGWRAWVAAVGVGAAAPGLAVASADFAPRQTVKSSGSNNALALGDLNGDSVLDLVTASDDSDAAIIHRGLGGGQFAAGSAVKVGQRPYGVVIAELNGDGKPDIATANNGDKTVSVLIGDGAGGVASSTTIPVGVGPFSIVARDLNADTKTDLAVINGDSRNLSLLIGDGAGGFTHSLIGAGGQPSDLAAADLTGDGKIDLVVSNGGTDEGLRVLPGAGDGTFAAPSVLLKTGLGPFGLDIADLNADGRLDVAVGNVNSYDVSVFMGLGSTSFNGLPRLAASNAPVSVAIGDLNADGVPDIAVANRDSGDVSVLEGAGGGAFRKAVQFRTASAPTSVHAADLNGDGRSDLVAGSFDGTVSVLISRPLAGGTGTAVVRRTCPTPRRIVAGTAIGCAALGMSRAQVVEYLGKAPSMVRDNRGYVYRYGKLRVHFRGDTNWVEAVETLGPAASLPGGLKVGLPGAGVKKRFPKATCSTSRRQTVCTVPLGRASLTAFQIVAGKIVRIAVALT